MELSVFGIKFTIDTIIAISAFIIALISLGISVHFWRRSFRPIVTAMVKTHAAGNMATIFDLEIMNTGSIPAKNIQLKAQQEGINKALGQDAISDNKRRWLCCFDEENMINILHNNSSVKCSFGHSKEKDQGFWKYKAKIPITIEYEGWFGKRYIQHQDIQVIDSNSFTGYHWGAE
ncbi:MAG: hypothetical protein GX874_04925 [Smithella sp.]|jgi:hypothetical protein|nr:hypothetical protein [Smithella sp.]